MFCIEPEHASSREAIAVISTGVKTGLDWEVCKEPKNGWTPIGSVDYCGKLLPKRQDEVIDFYPKFLRDYLNRHILLWKMNGIGGLFKGSFFIKDAVNYKSDFIAGVYSDIALDKGVYWLSDVVEFLQEWRYYVYNGKVCTTGWYDGNDEDEPAPKLEIDWPKDFSGAVDFGRLDTGEIALVESHPPFAVGWYGDNHIDFVNWQYNAWYSYSTKCRKKN